ncbi:MAG: hypothetical protein IT483_11385 [Gammaproteobacteria bacterium]|nr:hypothetical protein [Gammaproteobacteria bacterium]
MDASLQLQTMFHLTGRRPAPPLVAVEGIGLRPALLARYRDLARLRYDFPLVLVESGANGPVARSLSDLVSELARNVASAGPTGEALRKQLLNVERRIRRAVAGGASGRLSALWKQAVAEVTATGDPRVADTLNHAGRTLGVDGEVLDCSEAMPARLLTHAWRNVQAAKLSQARAEIDSLIVRLNDILRADFVRSGAGRTAEGLKTSVGTRQQGLFDFAMMSRLLAHTSPDSRLSATRRRRIDWALSVLRSQRFFPAAGVPGHSEPAYEFSFDTCRGARQAFQDRLPAMAELVKAMSVAELEGSGRYDESKHDAFFDGFDAGSLSPQDMATFPDYFVSLRGRPTDAAKDTNLLELLSSGFSVKVLVETDDILQESSAGQGNSSFGVRSVQLASLAIGLNDTFVLQSTSSNLLQMQGRVLQGLATAGPALFSVFTPSAAHAGGLPHYLASAAAMQSRAFPAFSYDPAAGAELASRFSLDDNPQPDSDWPVAKFEYADAGLQRVSEELSFTLADFVATDSRYAQHFALVPHGSWSGSMTPIGEWFRPDAAREEGRVPYLLAVDEHDVLQRLIVDDKLVQAARRCLDNWHRLQELGGVHNSHADRLLARERAVWDEQKRQELAALASAAPPAAPTPAAAPQAAVADAAEAPAPEPERSKDEAYIETIRCSTCNECTQLNGQMFAYNENKQAYIKDLKAGTYRQLVEAAEGCQLSIIHPGKPLNPNEPGLAELVERAQPFL